MLTCTLARTAVLLARERVIVIQLGPLIPDLLTNLLGQGIADRPDQVRGRVNHQEHAAHRLLSIAPARATTAPLSCGIRRALRVAFGGNVQQRLASLSRLDVRYVPFRASKGIISSILL